MVTKHYRSRMLYIHTRWFTLVANTEQWSNLAIGENYSSRFERLICQLWETTRVTGDKIYHPAYVLNIVCRDGEYGYV